MPKAKDTVTRNKAKGLLESHWRPQDVATKLYISQATAYGWEQRMQMFHGQIDRPEHLQMVSPSRWLAGQLLLTFQRKQDGHNKSTLLQSNLCWNT
jgi:hypothetical protein